MARKELINLTVADPDGGGDVVIPVGVARGDDEGPVLTVIGGVHGTEYAAQDAVMRFWDEIDPEGFQGGVNVVLCADVTAAQAHSAYVNPVDGKNLNRVWPGDPDGTLTDRIAAAITTELIEESVAVIDVHGGEWDEDIDCFIITHVTGDEELDARNEALAMSLGFTYVEFTPADGDVLGRGTGSGAAMLGGRPGITLEAGGAGTRAVEFVRMHTYALHNALRHLGIAEGEPLLWDGQPVRLDHGVLMKAQEGGLYRPRVTIGDWIEEGEAFAEVLDMSGAVVETLRAPESGTVLDVIISRWIKPGGFAGKLGIL